VPVPVFKKVPAVFYRTVSGKEPVRDWIKGLTLKDRKIVGGDIATAEYGWPVGMPVCRPLEQGIWEIRSNLTDGIARVLFFFHQGKLVLLHGFVKKTQKSPGEELNLAAKRKREVENG
jgi:phage-related protein